MRKEKKEKNSRGREKEGDWTKETGGKKGEDRTDTAWRMRSWHLPRGWEDVASQGRDSGETTDDQGIESSPLTPEQMRVPGQLCISALTIEYTNVSSLP